MNKKRILFIIGGGLLIIIAGVLFTVMLPVEKSSNLMLEELKSETYRNRGTGCLFNDEKMRKDAIYKYAVNYISGANNSNIAASYINKNNTIPSNYSLEDYLPKIGDQGDLGSCVGWSTTYYGFTIVKRLIHGKNYPAFSPLSVFNRYSFKKGLDPCKGGAYIDECLAILMNQGCPFNKDYDKPNCSIDKSKKKYKDFLYNYERIQSNNAKQIKMALANNNPVIIGIDVYAGGSGNNLNTKFLDSNGVLKLENFRNNKYLVSGHALCVVGYDDNVGGGAFKIVNSWGKDWGKDGFFWIRYNDLQVVRCAYAMFADKE